MEKPGQESRWNTLRALGVLRARGAWTHRQRSSGGHRRRGAGRSRGGTSGRAHSCREVGRRAQDGRTALVKAAAEPMRARRWKAGGLLQVGGGAVHGRRLRSIHSGRVGRARSRGPERRPLAAPLRGSRRGAARDRPAGSGDYASDGLERHPRVALSARTGSESPTIPSRYSLRALLGRMARGRPADPSRGPVVSRLAVATPRRHNWAGNVCYIERGAILIDWASAQVGDHRVDLAYALLSICETGECRHLSSSPTRPPMRSCLPAAARTRPLNESASRSSMSTSPRRGASRPRRRAGGGVRAVAASIAAGRMRSR